MRNALPGSARGPRIAALLAILLAVCAGMWFVVGREAGKTPPPPAYVLPEAFFASFGDGRMYDYRIRTAVDYSAGAEQNATMVQEMTGTMNVRLLERGERSSVLAVQFSPLSLSFLMNGSDSPVDPMAETLMRQMFLVTVGSRGEVTGFDFPPDMEANLTTILEGALRTVQVILPSSAERNESGGYAWRAMERDSNGECMTGYTASASGNLRKRRLSYAPGVREDAVRISILSSDITGSLDDAWIVNLSGIETSEFISGTSRLAYAENRFSMERVPFEPDKNARIWSETRTPEQIRAWFALQKRARETERKVADAERAKTPEDAAKRYRAELVMLLRRDIATNRDRFAELLAYLNDNPEAALLIPDLLLGSTDDMTDNYAILALQTSGTPQAQSALCTILADDRHKRMNRLRATTAFSFVENPTDDAIQVLRQVADAPTEPEYASTALLALGGSAFRVREKEPGRYAPLADDLRKRLEVARQSEEPGAERTALLAIGNARDAEFLPQVAPYLDSEDPAYRALAAGTLRNMRGEGVTELLCERISADPNANVRRAAAKSLAEQPADNDTVKYVSGAIQKETDGTVATDMARYLGRAAKTNPDARNTLESLWDKTENRDVLRVIRDVRRGRTP